MLPAVGRRRHYIVVAHQQHRLIDCLAPRRQTKQQRIPGKGNLTLFMHQREQFLQTFTEGIKGFHILIKAGRHRGKLHHAGQFFTVHFCTAYIHRRRRYRQRLGGSNLLRVVHTITCKRQKQQNQTKQNPKHYSSAPFL